MKAIASYVWVKPIYQEKKTSSGLIHLLEADIPAPTRGTVVAIGALCDKIMLGDLKEGDTVMFDPDHIRRVPNPETGEENFIFLDRVVIAIV